MTTANLTVGIDTAKAKENLIELKRWMKAEMDASAMQLAIRFDAKSIDEEIQRYFKQRTFHIKIGTANLKNIGAAVQGELDNALAYVMAKPRRIKLDLAHLIASVQTAVGAGLAGGALAKSAASKLADALDGPAVSRTSLKAQTPKIDTAAIAAELATALNQVFAREYTVNASTERVRAELASALRVAFDNPQTVQFAASTLRTEVYEALKTAFAIPQQVNLDSASLTAEVKKALDLGFSVPQRVNVDGSAVHAEVSRAINAAFAAPQAVNADETRLRAEVAQAVAQGTAVPQRLEIDDAALRAEINRTVTSSFTIPQRIDVDEAKLRAEVMSAVDLALSPKHQVDIDDNQLRLATARAVDDAFKKTRKFVVDSTELRAEMERALDAATQRVRGVKVDAAAAKVEVDRVLDQVFRTGRAVDVNDAELERRLRTSLLRAFQQPQAVNVNGAELSREVYRRLLQAFGLSQSVKLDTDDLRVKIANSVYMALHSGDKSVDVDTARMRAEVGNALEREFTFVRRVNVDNSRLTAELQQARDIAFAEAKRVHIEKAALTSDIVQAQAQAQAVKHRIDIDEQHLRTQIATALGLAFGERHHILVDTASLTLRLKEAVALGMAGAKLDTVVPVPDTTLMRAEIATALYLAFSKVQEVRIDAAALTAKVSAAVNLGLASAKLNLPVALTTDTSGLRSEVDRALDQELLKQRKLNIDTASVSLQIREAVALGLAGAKTAAATVLAAPKAVPLPDQTINAKVIPLFNEAALTAEILVAIEKAFLKVHRIQVDEAALTLQIRSAVAAGLAGGRLGTVAAAAPTEVSRAAAVSPAVGGALVSSGLTDIMQSVKSSLEPAINELARAAALVGGTARKIGAGTQSPSTTVSAKRGLSAKDPVTGESISRTEKIDPDQALSAIRAANTLKSEKQSAGDLARSLGLPTRDEALGIQVKDAPRLDPRTLLGLPTRDEMKSASDQLRAQMQGQLDMSNLKAKSATRLDPRTLLGLPTRDEMKSASDQLRAQMQGQLDMSSLKAKSATRLDPRALLGLPTRDEMKSASDQLRAQMQGQLDMSSLKAKSATRLDPRTLLGLPTRDEMKSASNQLRAQMLGQLNDTKAFVEARKLQIKDLIASTKLASSDTYTPKGQAVAAYNAVKSAFGSDDADRAFNSYIRSQSNNLENFRRKLKVDADSAAVSIKQAMQQVYNAAKWDAEPKMTARGSKLAGARAVVQDSRFTPEQARGFLKNDALFAQASSATAGLGEYERKVKTSTAATHAWTTSMRDAHSAARGLAGSMGQMWLTWGNVAPLVAAAALGAAIRSIVTAGKDLEYQLKFVSLLSDNATVSVKDFGNSIHGLMVGPVEASKAMRGLAQNGLDVGQALAALPTILRLATAGEMGLAEAALGATGVMEAFNLTVGDLGHVADVFTKAAAISNTSVSEMVEAMKQASTVSDNYRISLDETAATLAVLAQRNIRGSAAGTAFRNMLTNLANPTDHAKEAMKLLGLELYDGANRLKPYNALLQELSSKLSGVNEKSKNALLGAIFNERGFKGASAMINDLDEYGRKLEEIKNGSKDFTKQINEGLGETTQGKLKSLMAEFQTATSNAFYGADSALKNFADSLRVLVSSDEFTRFLNSLTTGIVRLSSALIEHGSTIALVLGVWAGFGISKVIVQGLVGMSAALLSVEATALGTATAMRVLGLSAGAASIAMKALWASATLGLSVAAALAVEYLFLSQKTSEADEAQKAFNNNLRLQIETMDRSIDALDKEAARIERRNELIARGVPLAEAERQSNQVEIESKAITRDSARSDIDRLTVAKQKLEDVPAPGAGARSLADPQVAAWHKAQYELGKVNAELGVAINNYTVLSTAHDKAQTEYNKRESIRIATDSGNSRAAAIKFNENLNKIQKSNPKLDLGGLQADPIKAAAMGKEEAIEYMKGREDELGKRLRTVEVPDSKAASLARADELAKSRLLIAQLKAEEAEMTQYMKFRKDLDEAKYNPNLFGPFISAALAEQRAISETSALLEMQRRHIEKLEEARKSGTFNPADRTNIDKEIEQEKARFKLAQTKLQQDKELAAAKGVNRARTEADDFAKDLAKLGVKDQQRTIDVNESYRTKTTGPVQAASDLARQDVNKDYREKAVVQQLRVNEARVSEKILLEEKTEILTRLQSFETMALERTGPAAEAARQQSEALKADLATKEAGLQAAQQELAVQTSNLAILEAQGRAAATLAAENAAAQAEYARTAAYGWDKFWSDYVTTAESSAKLVEDSMKASVGAMQATLQDYFMTGKMDAKSLGETIRAELTRAFIVKPMMEQIAGLGKILGDGVMQYVGLGAKQPGVPKLGSDELIPGFDFTELLSGTTAQAAASNSATSSMVALTQAAYAAANALATTSVGGGASGLGGLLSGVFGGQATGLTGAGTNIGGFEGANFIGGALPFAKGGTFSPTAAVQRFAKGGTFTNRIITRPTPFTFAQGSMFGEMGEAGDEAVVPLTRGPGGSLGISAYGANKGASKGSLKVELNVINNGPPVKAKATQRETPEGTVIDLVLDAVANDMASGGRVHDATQRRFGLNPGGTTPRY